MINNVLILDTETTGLSPHSPHNNKLIEIGALLYNIEYRVVTQTLSGFLPCEINDVEHINHIKAEWTRLCNPDWVLDALCDMASGADAIVAHNVPFDKMFMETGIAKPHYFWSLPWICTKTDFKWPVPLARNRLQDICEAMGVPYVKAHRSLADCQFIVECFNRVEDLQLRLERCVR